MHKNDQEIYDQAKDSIILLYLLHTGANMMFLIKYNIRNLIKVDIKVVFTKFFNVICPYYLNSLIPVNLLTVLQTFSCV